MADTTLSFCSLVSDQVEGWTDNQLLLEGFVTFNGPNLDYMQDDRQRKFDLTHRDRHAVDGNKTASFSAWAQAIRRQCSLCLDPFSRGHPGSPVGRLVLIGRSHLMCRFVMKRYRYLSGSLGLLVPIYSVA
jgi:hypothetical protein